MAVDIKRLPREQAIKAIMSITGKDKIGATQEYEFMIGLNPDDVVELGPDGKPTDPKQILEE